MTGGARRALGQVRECLHATRARRDLQQDFRQIDARHARLDRVTQRLQGRRLRQRLQRGRIGDIGWNSDGGIPQRLGHGLSFNGRPLPPVKVSVSSRNDAQTRLRFALKGVRPGQVPFMCDSVGLRLLALKRIRLGRVALAQLPPGQWRYLLPHERF